MVRQGLIGLVVYLTWVAVWTFVARGALHVGGKYLVKWMPDTADVIQAAESYGWWIAAAVGAIIAIGLS